MDKRSNRPFGLSAPNTLTSPGERYRSIFDHAGEGIYQSSLSGKILDVNPALAKYFGYGSPEEMKNDIIDISRQVYADHQMRKKILCIVEAKGKAKFEFQFLRKDKSMGWGYASKYAIRNAKGKTLYYEGFFLDITDRKEMEEQLRKAHDLLEQRVNERTRKISQLNKILALDIAKRKKIEKELKQRNVKLEELNITLRTLLDQREIDRKDLERQIMINIDDLIIPSIERLKDATLTEQANSLIQSLQDNLQTLTSPFLSKIKSITHLSSTELQIANFIKKGKRSKQIAATMKLSAGTVDFHRNNIRKKLGIRGEKISLHAYLLSQS